MPRGISHKSIGSFMGPLKEVEEFELDKDAEVGCFDFDRWFVRCVRVQGLLLENGVPIQNWLVVWNSFYFSIFWE